MRKKRKCLSPYRITFDTFKFGLVVIFVTALCVMAVCVLNKKQKSEKAPAVKHGYARMHAKYPQLTPEVYGIIVDECARYDDTPRRVCAQINEESGFVRYSVSRKGAKGYAQLTDKTAAALGVTDPFDPVQNIRAGMKHYHLTCLKKARGNHFLALEYYNGGHNRKTPARESVEYAVKVTLATIMY